MTDKDTKCLISKAKQDMMPQTPDPQTMFLPTKTIFGILVMGFLFALSLTKINKLLSLMWVLK